MIPCGAGLLDTSVFIARESGRHLGELPERTAICVVTLGELELGVRCATSDQDRERRADTLAVARAFDPLPITESVMSVWSEIVADCRRGGVTRAVKLADSLIAAAAVDAGLPVVTQDADYDKVAQHCERLHVVRV